MPRFDHWPLFGLRVRTPRLELRYPSDDDIAEIAQRSVTEGIHDPAWMPFGFEWTDVPPPMQQRRSMQFHWTLRANWQPEHWHCNLAAFSGGRVLGAQSAEATDFARLGEVMTGSFLFRSAQGHGLGTEMRAAILHLAFAGLGAEHASTAAWADNAPSLGVTRRLGYEPTGTKRMLSRGVPRDMLTFRLSRETWEANRRDDIVVEGLGRCLDLFGVPRADTCAGLDGCRAGWVVATREGVSVVASVEDVLARRHRAVGVDMPIGLAVDGERQADRAARRFLSPRGSTIFSTPPRSCLGAIDHAQACARSAEASGKRISLQSFHILDKIGEIDRAISPADEDRVVEVHPECSFAEMNGGSPLVSKHSADGLAARAALIEREFGAIPPTPRGAARDDVLDAYAVLWTAERFAHGQHRELGVEPRQRDERGLLMRIVV
jgi:predicted RNase H-like nuclease/RimJ/RimL family protein N-acetyltransferase